MRRGLLPPDKRKEDIIDSRADFSREESVCFLERR